MDGCKRFRGARVQQHRAWILGRNMFGPVRGPWPDDSWKGWWGDNPPYHTPVFVLTSHQCAPITMEGGTIFHFVTDGIHAALQRAAALRGIGSRIRSNKGYPRKRRRRTARHLLVSRPRVHGRSLVSGVAEKMADQITTAESETEAFLAPFEPAWRPLDPQLRAVMRRIYGKLKGVPPPAELSVEELRRINASLSFYFNAGAPPLPHIEERIIDVPSGRARVRLYDPGTAVPAPTVVLLHGGGWVMGNADTYDGFARQIARRSGLRCLSVEYARAPEHPFPAPLDDCIAAVRWAASDGSALGIDGSRLALVGDSAGANLALGVCLALRDAGASPIRGAALLYGPYSLDFDSPSQRAFGSGAYFLGTAEIARYANDYLPNPAARQNPLAVPMLADLANLPPLYIGACEFDPLLNDSERLMARATSMGTQAELRVWQGMVHAAVSLMGWIDAMGPEVDRVGAFLRRVTSGG
jgi:acetyl esterase